MQTDRYQAYAEKETIRRDISVRFIECVSYGAKLQSCLKRNAEEGIINRIGIEFYEHFYGLFIESSLFVKADKKIVDGIKEYLEKGIYPPSLVEKFNEYIPTLKTAGLIELGWREMPLGKKFVER